MTAFHAPDGPAANTVRGRSGWPLRTAFLIVLCGLLLAGAAAVSTIVDTAALLVASPVSADAPPIPGAAPAPTDEDPNVWDRHGPVNVLLIGADQGLLDGCRESSYKLTDTLIVVRFDSSTGKAGLMAIPRDLYVPMPERPARKITTAYALAENAEEGSGPGYLKQVIETTIGVPIHRHVLIDISGFERVVDELGGIEIDVPPSRWDPTVGLYDPDYPTADCGTMVVEFLPGPQTLTGAEALQYARSRKTTSDFDRSRRQMDVLMAMRDKAMEPSFVLRARGLLPALLETVETDFTAREIIGLSFSAKDVAAEDILRYSIDSRVVYDDWLLIDGVEQSVLRPHLAAIAELRASFLALVDPAYPTAEPPAAAQQSAPAGAAPAIDAAPTDAPNTEDVIDPTE